MFSSSHRSATSSPHSPRLRTNTQSKAPAQKGWNGGQPPNIHQRVQKNGKGNSSMPPGDSNANSWIRPNARAIGYLSTKVRKALPATNRDRWPEPLTCAKWQRAIHLARRSKFGTSPHRTPALPQPTLTTSALACQRPGVGAQCGTSEQQRRSQPNSAIPTECCNKFECFHRTQTSHSLF